MADEKRVFRSFGELLPVLKFDADKKARKAKKKEPASRKQGRLPKK